MKQVLILEDNDLTRNKLKRLIDEILTRGESTSKLPERMYFRNDGITYPLDVAEIRYVVHQNRILHVYNAKECIEVPNLPLKRFLSLVRDSVFLSPLKGTAVNIAYIESVDYVNQFIKIKGIKNPISMGTVMKKRFRKQYETYVKRGY